MNRTYMCIDLKTFFASVECVERGLDPFKTCLVVADPTRGNGAICLAVSPKMKALGVRNRCRIFEIPKNITYITAMPRMKKYIDYSANIYSIYLKYIAKEDIHPYSIDEMFLDVTRYLKLYNLSAEELAKKITDDIYTQTGGITATVGIGTNLFLAKIAMDIIAKHTPSNMAYLDEEGFKKELWHHQPLTDFWQVGRGITKRLAKMGIVDMADIAQANPDQLYKEFGVNAEFLIDHANGKEPTTIAEIKAYKRQSKSLSLGQVLFEDYDYDKARLAMKEMVDLISLDLVDKGLVTNCIGIGIGYSKDAHRYTGGHRIMTQTTNVFSILCDYAMQIFDQTTCKNVPIRNINIWLGDVKDEAYEQLDLFTSPKEVEKERKLETTLNQIKGKYGKNSILRGMNYLEGATTRRRNKLIGGHNSGE